MPKEIKVGLTRYNLTLQCIDENILMPIGYLSILIDNTPEKNTGHLMGLIRHPDYKGQGACKTLFEKAIDILKGYNCNLIITGVHDSRVGIHKLLVELGFDIRENKSIEHTKFEMRLNER